MIPFDLFPVQRQALAANAIEARDGVFQGSPFLIIVI